MKRESAVSEAQQSKIDNIVHWGIGYSTMLRVFKSDSKDEIAEKLMETYKRLGSVRGKKDYLHLHRSFCDWFISAIRTAPRRLKNGRTKASRWASYGQAAKTLDVAMKVLVYYCGLPDKEAAKIVPWLNCAIDTKILRQLKKRYPEVADLEANTVEGIDTEETYMRLQSAVMKHIRDKYAGRILPVQYDDIEHGQL